MISVIKRIRRLFSRLFQRTRETTPALTAAQSATRDGINTEDAAWYFAQPIHLEARMEHLVPSAELSTTLTAEEWAELEALLNQHFVVDDLRFFARPPQLYLRVAQPFAFHPGSVTEILGRPIASHWPSTPEARPQVRALARLLNEIQMRLHEHPFNEAREARGDLAVNGLWLWDAAPSTPPLEGGHLARQRAGSPRSKDDAGRG